MRVLLGVALAALIAPAGAQAAIPPIEPAAALAADGTAAVVFPDADGLQLSVDGAPAAHVPGSEDAVGRAFAGPKLYGVMADARVIWVTRVLDRVRPVAAFEYQVVDSDGERLSPVLPGLPQSLDVAAAADGAALVSWWTFDGSGAAYAAPGQAFAPVPGAIPARPAAAVADGGRALLVGQGVEYREAAGGVFAPLSRVATPVSHLQDARAALAPDGSALIVAHDNRGDAYAFRRAGTGHLQQSWTGHTSDTPAPGAGNGGIGVIAFPNGRRMVVRALGGATRRYRIPALGLHPASVAVRADGSAVVGVPSRGLIARPAGGTFGPLQPPSLGNARYALAVNARSTLAASGRGQVYRSARDGAVSVLGTAPPVLAPALEGTLSVPDGAFRVVNDKARVPVVCTGAGTCYGSVLQDGRQVTEVVEDPGVGRFVRVPVADDAAQLTVTLNGAPVTRPLDRTPDTRVCPLPPWAMRLDTDLFGVRGDVVYSGEETAHFGTRVVLCRPGEPVREVVHSDIDVPAGAVNGDTVALVERSDIVRLRVYDLGTADQTGHDLFGDNPLDPLDYDVLAVRLADGGTVALMETLDGQPRVRLLDTQGDRVVDAAPGIDPASLAVDGDTFTWQRDGVTRTA